MMKEYIEYKKMRIFFMHNYLTYLSSTVYKIIISGLKSTSLNYASNYFNE